MRARGGEKRERSRLLPSRKSGEDSIPGPGNHDLLGRQMTEPPKCPVNSLLKRCQNDHFIIASVVRK